MAPSSGHSSNLSSSSSSAGERPYHAPNGKPAMGTPRHERTPATPRKEGSGRERAMQDPGLKDYVGACYIPTVLRAATDFDLS